MWVVRLRVERRNGLILVASFLSLFQSPFPPIWEIGGEIREAEIFWGNRSPAGGGAVTKICQAQVDTTCSSDMTVSMEILCMVLLGRISAVSLLIYWSPSKRDSFVSL